MHQSGLAALTGIFMLAVGGVFVPALPSNAQTQTEASQPAIATREELQAYIDAIPSLTGYRAVEDRLDHIRAIIRNNPELRTYTLSALAPLLQNKEIMRDVAHAYSFIADRDTTADDDEFTHALKEPLQKFIEATIGTKGEEASERIYLIRNLAHNSPALTQMEIDLIPQLLADADMTTWQEVISSYFIINRNFPGQFTGEVAEALKAPLAALLPHIQHDNPNVRINVARLSGQIGSASAGRHALEVMQALAPLYNDDDARVRLVAVSSSAFAGGEDGTPESAALLMQSLAPLAEKSATLEDDLAGQVQMGIWVTGFYYSGQREKAAELLSVIIDQDHRRSYYAIRDLASLGRKHGDSDIADILKNYAASENATLALNGVKGLVEMTQEHPQFLPDTFETLKAYTERTGNHQGAIDLFLDIAIEHEDYAQPVITLLTAMGGNDSDVLLDEDVNREIARIASDHPEAMQPAIALLTANLNRAAVKGSESLSSIAEQLQWLQARDAALKQGKQMVPLLPTFP